MKFIKLSVKRWSKSVIVAVHDILYVESQGYSRCTITFRNMQKLTDVLVKAEDLQAKLDEVTK
jgi:hypothetical protein